MPRSTTQAKRSRLKSFVQGGRLTRTGELAAIAACALLLVLVSLGIHATKYPDFSSFWVGVDQQRYRESARAWAALDFTPARHHYLPFYPLLGAAFLWLTPWQPFMLPDAACLAACLLIFVRIGRRLAPAWPDWSFGLCFLAATFGGRTLLAIWVVPWSTTGAAPCQFAALLLALRFGERPSATRAFLLGAVIALTAGFRPSDAAVLLAGAGFYAAFILLRIKTAPRAAVIIILSAALGLAAGLLPVAAGHLAIYGADPGPYASKSAGIGFEWRLLPMRWVMLVIDPRPLLPEGQGLAEALPWVIPGIAGMLLALLPRPGHRVAPTLFVAATITLHWAMYLAYRDLQSYGLWRFYNVHYFKWTFPFLVLWAAQLAAALRSPVQRRRAALVTCATLALFAWRPILRKPVAAPLTLAGGVYTLPKGAPSLDSAIALPLTGTWTGLYFGNFPLIAGGHEYRNTSDDKILPVPGGALLLPLRPLPPGPATLALPPNVSMPSPAIATTYRQAVVFGLPCVFRVGCHFWPVRRKSLLF